MTWFLQIFLVFSGVHIREAMLLAKAFNPNTSTYCLSQNLRHVKRTLWRVLFTIIRGLKRYYSIKLLKFNVFSHGHFNEKSWNSVLLLHALLMGGQKKSSVAGQRNIMTKNIFQFVSHRPGFDLVSSTICYLSPRGKEYL